MAVARPDGADPARRTAALCAAVALALGVGLAMALAGVAGPASSVWLRAVALGASVLLVGLGSIEALGVEPSLRVVGASAVLWLVAGVGGVWLETAERAGSSPLRVSVDEFTGTWSQRPGDLIGVVCAAAVAVWALGRLTDRMDVPAGVVAGVAGVGVVATAVAGHASSHQIGPVLVGVHAAAAAWWCGTLVALAVTVRGRAGWAAALPRFSTVALPVVMLLTASGVAAAVVNLEVFGAHGFSVLWGSGYGRILVAKTAALTALVSLASAHRRRWVPQARAHRTAKAASVRNATVEIVMMAVALGLAAGLAGTAPA